MKRVPRVREVNQAILAVSREVKRAVKELNQQAAKLLARGDYEGAQAMVETGRRLHDFQNKVRSLQEEWRELRSAAHGGGEAHEEHTPLWQFYQPILQSLVALGGEAKRRDLEDRVGETLEGHLKPGDSVTNARGVPRWKRMVARARKPMTAEGFLEDGKGPVWRITDAGRRTAKKGITGQG